MNVLFVVPWDNIGGVSHVVNRVAEYARGQGNGVYFLLPGPGDTPVPATSRAGFPAYQFNLRPPSIAGRSLRSRVAYALTMPLTLLHLARLVRRLRIDVVNIHYPGGNKIYFAILRRLGVVRLVTSIHGADLLPNGARQPLHTREVLRLLDASDAVVAPSDAYHRSVRETWPAFSSRPYTIRNGVDPAELGYTPEADETEDPPFVLSILHLVHYKGVDVLIRAFAALAADYPRVRLRLVSDGPQRREYEALAASLGVGDRVEFLGIQGRDVVSSLLRRCTLFVLPSRTNSESFGIAAAEAMAVDRPVILSRVGGLPDLVEDGLSGLLVPPDDVPSLECAMRRMLDDPAPRQRMGRLAGMRVRQQFHWDRACALYQNLFEALAPAPDGEKHRPPAIAAPVDAYQTSAQRERSQVDQRSSVSLTPVGQPEEGW